MLHELNISNLGIIDHTQLNLTDGLNVITGETGAGKTMLLTGVDFIRGNKIDSAKVNPDKGTNVEAILDIEDEDLLSQLKEADVPDGENANELIAVRSTNGARSKSVLNGRTVPAALLASCLNSTMTVHGQAEQGRLRSPAQQREILDQYAGSGTQEVKAEYGALFQQVSRYNHELENLISNKKQFDLRIAMITDELKAIEELDPHEGEDEEVRNAIKTMSSSEDIRETLSQALAVLEDEDSGFSVTSAANRAASNAEEAYEQSSVGDLEEIASNLREGAGLIEEASAALASYLNSLDYDPEEMERLQERKGSINALCRRLGKTLDEIVEYRTVIEDELSQGSDWQEHISSLKEKLTQAKKNLAAKGKELTKLRSEAAASLAAAVNEELEELAMKGSIFSVAVSKLDMPAVHGEDEINMLLAGHAKAKPMPVHSSASGGELSRVMLAIEVALSARKTSNRKHTFIFDEIDAGVGGKAAVAIGRRLKKLATNAQVVVVTHLAQVAVFGNNHVLIEKTADTDSVSSELRVLSEENRVQEIARMLSGQDNSDTAVVHAEELLDEAKAYLP